MANPRPRILVIGTRYMMGDPKKGPSSIEQLVERPFQVADFADLELFLVDVVHLGHGGRIDPWLLQLCDDEAIDLIVLIWWPGGPRHLNPSFETLYALRSERGIPIVAAWFDTWDSWLVAEADRVTPFVSFSVVTDNVEHFAASRHRHAYHRLLPPMDLQTFCDPDLPRDLDVSFVGGVGPYPDRQRGLETLKEAGVAVFRAGGQLEMPISLDEYAKTIQRSRISLSFSMSGGKQTLKGRTFEVPLCGALLLESDNPHTRRWLEPHEHYVPFSSPRELIEGARHYLAHEEERRRIAEAGRERVRELARTEDFYRRIWELSREPGLAQRDVAPEVVSGLLEAGAVGRGRQALATLRQDDAGALDELEGALRGGEATLAEVAQTPLVHLARGLDARDAGALDLSEFWDPRAGTFLIEAQRPRGVQEDARVLSLSDGTYHNYLDVLLDAAGQRPCCHVMGDEVSGPHIGLPEGSWPPGQAIRVALSYQGEEISLVANGFAHVGVSGLPEVQELAWLTVGRHYTAPEAHPIFFRQLSYLPVALPETLLLGLTSAQLDNARWCDERLGAICSAVDQGLDLDW